MCFSILPWPVVGPLRCFPNEMAETLILIDVCSRRIRLTTGYKALEQVEFCCCFCFICRLFSWSIHNVMSHALSLGSSFFFISENVDSKLSLDTSKEKDGHNLKYHGITCQCPEAGRQKVPSSFALGKLSFPRTLQKTFFTLYCPELYHAPLSKLRSAWKLELRLD